MGISYTRAAAAVRGSSRCRTPGVRGAGHKPFPRFVPHPALHANLAHVAGEVWR
jgi:hypothetical protein